MKHILIMMMLCTGLMWGCNSKNRGSKAYGKKGKKAPYYAGHKKSNTASSTNKSNQPKAQVDSLVSPERNTSVRPGTYYGGISGPGSGGSYASSAYRHDEMNRKKYEKKALTAMKQRKQINQSLEKLQTEDTISTKADSLINSW